MSLFDNFKLNLFRDRKIDIIQFKNNIKDNINNTIDTLFDSIKSKEYTKNENIKEICCIKKTLSDLSILSIENSQKDPFEIISNNDTIDRLNKQIQTLISENDNIDKDINDFQNNIKSTINNNIQTISEQQENSIDSFLDNIHKHNATVALFIAFASITLFTKVIQSKKL
tara:strand:- start:5468 stop:5977 length:510 start_codon:yes stop_codon:yes gene_type:complete